MHETATTPPPMDRAEFYRLMDFNKKVKEETGCFLFDPAKIAIAQRTYALQQMKNSTALPAIEDSN